MQGVFTIEPSADGFAMTSENSSQTLIWDNIVKWRENDKFILIYIMPALFYVIPKVFITAEGKDPAIITDHLKSHLGQSK